MDIEKKLKKIDRIKNKKARKLVWEYISLKRKNVRNSSLPAIATPLIVFFNYVFAEHEDIKITKKKVQEFMVYAAKKYRKATLKTYTTHIIDFLKENNSVLVDSLEDVSKILTVKITKQDTMRVTHKSQLPLITEIKKMLDYANTRDRAIIAVLFETGIRVGELVNIKLRDVRINEKYVEISITQSKTEPRTVYLVHMWPYLKDWLQIHPLRDNKNAYLFVSRTGKQMRIEHVDIRLYYISERATGKKYSAHLFRHLRATILMAKKFPIVQLKKLLGWTIDSNMPSRYIHLIDEDVENAVLDFYGIKKIEKKDEEEILLTNCPRCGAKNPLNAVYCSQCGFVLKTEKIEDAKKAEDMKMKILKLIAEDNELLDLIAKKLSQ